MKHNADHNRRQDRDQGQPDQFLLGGYRADLHGRSIVGLDLAFHQSRDAELPAHLIHDEGRGAGHGVNQCG